MRIYFFLPAGLEGPNRGAGRRLTLKYVASQGEILSRFVRTRPANGPDHADGPRTAHSFRTRFGAVAAPA